MQEKKNLVFCVQLKKKKTNQQFKMKGIIILSDLCFCSADLKLVFWSIFSAQLWFLLHFNCQWLDYHCFCLKGCAVCVSIQSSRCCVKLQELTNCITLTHRWCRSKRWQTSWKLSRRQLTSNPKPGCASSVECSRTTWLRCVWLFCLQRCTSCFVCLLLFYWLNWTCMENISV